jgi:hypothetical protein
MLLQLAFLFFLLLLLFLLAKKIHQAIYTSCYLATRNQNLSLKILALFILPGTIIHEISHFVIASILRVPTGELSVIPTVEKGKQVRAGKLSLGKSDPFRLSLIGLAPIFIGLILIYLIGKFFLSAFSPFLLFAIYYLLFTISITMFSSKKDLVSLWITLPVTFLLLTSLYLIGVRLFLEENFIQKANAIASGLNYYLLITTIIDYFILIILSINNYLWKKILKGV